MTKHMLWNAVLALVLLIASVNADLLIVSWGDNVMAPDDVPSPVNTTAPDGSTIIDTSSACPNKYVSINGGCVPLNNITPLGWTAQGWTNLFKASGAVLFILAFLGRGLYIFNNWKADSTLRSPFRDFRFWACANSVFYFLCTFFAHITTYVFTSTTGLIVFLVLYAIFIGGQAISKNLIAMHFANDMFFNYRSATKTITKRYSVIAQIIIGVSIFMAVFYMIWLIVVTLKFKSLNVKINAAGWHIMVALFATQILASGTMFGVSYNIYKKYASSGYNVERLRALKMTITWAAMSMVLGAYSIIDIYWFFYEKTAISTEISPDIRKLITLQAANMQEFHIREKLNYFIYANAFMDFLILDSGSCDIIFFENIYYFFVTAHRKDMFQARLNSRKDNSGGTHSGSGKVNSSSKQQHHSRGSNGTNTAEMFVPKSPRNSYTPDVHSNPLTAKSGPYKFKRDFQRKTPKPSKDEATTSSDDGGGGGDDENNDVTYDEDVSGENSV